MISWICKGMHPRELPSQELDAWSDVHPEACGHTKDTYQTTQDRFLTPPLVPVRLRQALRRQDVALSESSLCNSFLGACRPVDTSRQPELAGDVMLMKQSEGFLLFITYLSSLAAETLRDLLSSSTLSRRGAATLAIYGILAILQGRQAVILHENPLPGICGKSATQIQEHPQLERSPFRLFLNGSSMECWSPHQQDPADIALGKAPQMNRYPFPIPSPLSPHHSVGFVGEMLMWLHVLEVMCHLCFSYASFVSPAVADGCVWM